MNLVQLRYFNAVCTYHTMSAAAEYLHISQPSVSNAVKELEEEFGVALFHRQRGMVLTREGETLLRLSADLLSRADDITDVMNDLGKGRKSLRLGIPPMIASLVMPDVYGGFLPLNPDVELDIKEAGRSELEKMLTNGYIDMAILPHNRPVEPHLNSVYVSSLEIVCCVPSDSHLAEKESISAYDLADADIVLFKNSFFQTEEIRKWFALSNVEPRILLQTEQLSTMQSIINGGIAVGFMFRHLVDSGAGFVPVSLDDKMCIDVSLVWDKDAYVFNAMKKFKEYINNNKILDRRD